VATFVHRFSSVLAIRVDRRKGRVALPDQEGTIAGGRRPVRWAWVIRGAIAAAALVLLATFYHPWFGGNFSAVSPGRVYRSSQPKADLETMIREHRLASILNLRGGSRADPWYSSEVRVARERGVAFYDLPLSATRRPKRWELLTLLDFFRTCPYPLLIHCKSGSDRTGLASALYLMAVLGDPPERALRAFSVRHGHVPIWGPERLHEPFVEYDAWLEGRRLPHTPDRFRDWVVHHYRADDPAAGIHPLLPGPRAPRLAEGMRPEGVDPRSPRR